MKTIKLPFRVKGDMLACGADVKGSFALAKGDRIYLIDGFGDLADPENLAGYEKAIRSALRKLGICPKVIAHDLNPGYFSTKYALRFEPRRRDSCAALRGVQHHEAHVASALTSGGYAGGVIGVAFDGTGYGPDGRVWGGEFFVVRSSPRGLDFKRAAHLKYVPMPGGEAAILEPWRMAAAYIYESFAPDAAFRILSSIYRRAADRRRPGGKELSLIKKLIDNRINTPLTSSMGRLFDAAGSLILRRVKAGQEGELPRELEKAAGRLSDDSYPFDIRSRDGIFEIDCGKMIRGIIPDMQKGMSPGALSDRFHNTIAEIILAVSSRLREKYRVKKIALTGGVFQNSVLLERAKMLLSYNGFEISEGTAAPVDDNGIPAGQIMIAMRSGRCA